MRIFSGEEIKIGKDVAMSVPLQGWSLVSYGVVFPVILRSFSDAAHTSEALLVREKSSPEWQQRGPSKAKGISKKWQSKQGASQQSTCLGYDFSPQ